MFQLRHRLLHLLEMILFSNSRLIQIMALLDFYLLNKLLLKLFVLLLLLMKSWKNVGWLLLQGKNLLLKFC